MDSEKLSYSSEELRYYLSHGKFKGRLSNKVTEAELNTIAWEGVYSSYDEIQKSSEYHTVAPTNTKEEIIHTAYIDDRNNRWKTLKDNLSKHSDKTRILEIGGDQGNTWVIIKEICDLEYYIVEIEKLVKHGRIIFPQINWYVEVPILENGIDILYTRATLQYIPGDVNKYLSDCIYKTSPKKIIIEQQPFSSKETFWTCQKYSGSILAWCFTNFEEFDSNIKQHGYELIYEHNDEYSYSQRINFPREKIYKYHKNLIYESIK